MWKALDHCAIVVFMLEHQETTAVEIAALVETLLEAQLDHHVKLAGALHQLVARRRVGIAPVFVDLEVRFDRVVIGVFGKQHGERVAVVDRSRSLTLATQQKSAASIRPKPRVLQRSVFDLITSALNPSTTPNVLPFARRKSSPT